MSKYLPFIVTVPLLAVLAAFQWRMMDWVWGENLPAQQCAYLLSTEVPLVVGDWVGTDSVVDERVRNTAGADGYIDRVYVNQKTKESVSIWFIVGHFRQVSRHTPNICYIAAGFEQVGDITTKPIVVPKLPTASFSTAKFKKNVAGQDIYQRVFWAWWKPEQLPEGSSADNVEIQWSNPESPRVEFGYCRALYKLYFTAVSTADEKPEDSVCLEFAQEFLPIANKAIQRSGLVMNKEELPEDAEQVLSKMEAANEGNSEETAKKEEEDGQEE